MRKQGKNLKYQMPRTFGTAESFFGRERSNEKLLVISSYPEITLEVYNFFQLMSSNMFLTVWSCCNHSVPTLVANISYKVSVCLIKKNSPLHWNYQMYLETEWINVVQRWSFSFDLKVDCSGSHFSILLKEDWFWGLWWEVSLYVLFPRNLQ